MFKDSLYSSPYLSQGHQDLEPDQRMLCDLHQTMIWQIQTSACDIWSSWCTVATSPTVKLTSVWPTCTVSWEMVVWSTYHSLHDACVHILATVCSFTCVAAAVRVLTFEIPVRTFIILSSLKILIYFIILSFAWLCTVGDITTDLICSIVPFIMANVHYSRERERLYGHKFGSFLN